jgi:S1-C subfamily serine protease
MIRRSFAELAKDLATRRRVGDKPPVLLLGAGASVDAGIGAMKELYDFFGVPDFTAFTEYIATTSATERYRYLAEFLQTREPGAVSPGYRALASLCAQGYFDLVLTTNMDPLLDDALVAARLWRRDYLLIVNGVIRTDRLDLLLRAQSPRVKLVKLHGDLFQPFMAWTVEEMDTFLAEISPHLAPVTAGRDFLVVGYSLRDARVRELVKSAGGSVWFTHPERVPEHLAQEPALRAVVAPECAFEQFFPALARALQVDVPAARGLVLAAEPAPKRGLALPARPAPERGRKQPARAPSAAAQTMDDLMAAVLAVAGADGAASATAFLLAEPRVIVADRFALAPCVRRGQVGLIASGGRRFTARVMHEHTGHPFGPTLLEAPASLQVAGLRLSASPPAARSVIQAVVAAGEKTGISTGTVTRPRMGALAIAPIRDKVPDLIALECVVAPGSSGAPVVDASLAVRGFIVAGSTDPDNPVSFAYPAHRWADLLHPAASAGGRSRRRSPRPRRG